MMILTRQDFYKSPVTGCKLHKGYDTSVSKMTEEIGNLKLGFTISTGHEDRDGDTLKPDGWVLDNYKRNPVVLFAHDSRAPAVGKGHDVSIVNDQLKAVVEFMPREMSELSYQLGLMYRDGFMKATSVGFSPLEWSYRDGPHGTKGIDFTKQELHEFSLVPVPANPQALIDAKSAGVDTTCLKGWAEQLLDSLETPIWLPRKTLETIAKTADLKNPVHVYLDRRVYDLTGKDLGPYVPVELEKRAISYNSAHPDGAPLAEDGTAWSGPAQVKEATVDDLKIMCAWVDNKNSEDKSAYKLPHHLAAGEHATVWRGVTAAMGALLGARGGVDIPDADRKGVYNHLAHHYKDFGVEPPEFKHVEAQVLKHLPESFDLDEVTGLLVTTKKVEEPSKKAPTLSAEDVIKMTAEIAGKELRKLLGRLD